MTKEQLVSRLLSTEGMISGTKLRTGKLDDNEWVRLIEAGDILSHTELYFDDSSGITVPEMKAKLRRLKDVDLVIIDYLQLMSGTKKTDNRVQEISDLTDLKIMAKQTQCAGGNLVPAVPRHGKAGRRSAAAYAIRLTGIWFHRAGC